jgi:hypothetical protein
LTEGSNRLAVVRLNNRHVVGGVRFFQ